MMESASSIEIIPNKLEFWTVNEAFHPPSDSKKLFFCVDPSSVYTSFFADFGPLDLGLTYTFCTQLSEKFREAEISKKVVIFHTPSHPHRRANAGVLICSFLVGQKIFCPSFK